MTFVMWPKTYQVLFFCFPLLLGWGIDPCHRYMFLITPLKSNMYPKKSMVGSTEISLISWSLCWATASFIFVISPHHTPPGTSCQEPSGPSVPRIWTLLELPPMIWRGCRHATFTPAQTKPDDLRNGTKSDMAAAVLTQKHVLVQCGVD